MPITPENFITLRDGQFDATSKPQLNALFAAFTRGRTNNLAIHFHGGLVSQASAMAKADRLLPIYEQGSVDDAVFFIWESGLLETIRDNTAQIVLEPFFQKALQHALGFVAGKVLQDPASRGTTVTPVDPARVGKEIDNVQEGNPSWIDMDAQRRAAVSELSLAEAQQLRDILQGDPALMTEVGKIANSIEPPNTAARSRGLSTSGSTRTLMSPKVLAQVQQEQLSSAVGARGFLPSPRLIKGVVVVVARVISRFIRKRDHGFHATVVEELFREFYVSAVGQDIWGDMKKATADAFQPNTDIFGGSAFLSLLSTVMSTKPKVTLIGHSAGAEYVCNMLRHCDSYLANAFAFDVVLMAPACRTELFADTLKNHGQRIRNFRCFTMNDNLEQNDRLVPIIYPHSLLYFISGVLEDEADKPILGMQRFLTGNAPDYQKPETGIPDAKAYLTAEGANRLLLSTCNDGLGLATNAISHGGFDDTDDPNARATIDSICYILKSGF